MVLVPLARMVLALARLALLDPGGADVLELAPFLPLALSIIPVPTALFPVLLVLQVGLPLQVPVGSPPLLPPDGAPSPTALHLLLPALLLEVVQLILGLPRILPRCIVASMRPF